MVEVLHKANHYKIQCDKCHSILKYDEFDELGKEECRRKLEEEQRKHTYNWKAINGELYILCPVCKYKVITTKIIGAVRAPLGEIINE